MPETTLITGAAAFDTLADEWRALHADSDADPLFLSWQWLSAWRRHLGRGRRLHVVVVRDAGTAIAIAPLIERAPTVRRLQPVTVLEFMGTGMAGSDYLDVIVRQGHRDRALAAVAAHCRAHRVALEFSHTDARGSHAARLAAMLGGMDWTAIAEPVEVCPVIALAGHDWDSYLATLGSSHRYNVRRRFRKLAQRFDVHYELADDEPARAAFFADLVRLHHLRRDTLGGSDGLADPAAIAFHDEFTTLALAAGWLRLTRLRIDGTVVAAVYCVRLGARHYFYQSGFDPAFGEHSVGLLALADSIRMAIEEGAAEYDFLHGDESYKYHWGAADRALSRHYVYPPRLGGLVARGLFGLKRQLKPCRAA